MKKLSLLLLMVLAVTYSVHSQDKVKSKDKTPGRGRARGELKSFGFKKVEISEVPEAVKNAFFTHAAGATNVRWEKHLAKGNADKSFTKYVAVYMQDGVRARARYREDGTALSSSKYMGAQKLPENIGTSAKAKNPGFELVGGEEVKTKKGETFYRVRMKKGSSRLTTLLDVNGNEVKRENQPEEAMEDEGDEGN